MRNQYTCSHCSFSSDSLEDFEEDFQYHQGFWCPYCDGFTYYDEKKIGGPILFFWKIKKIQKYEKYVPKPI